MKQIIILLITFNCVNAQSDVPLTLRSQFNGSFGYTIIGNTLNPNDALINPVCIMLTNSSATLNLSPSQTIEAAYLYWSGIGNGTFNPNIFLNGAIISANTTLVGSPEPFSQADCFGSYQDVTAFVQNTGNGLYTLSELDLNPITGNFCSTGEYFAGWAILVVFSESALPNVQLNVYDGFNVASQFFNGGITPLTINNLNVINVDNARLSYIAYRGSSNVFVAESIKFNNNILSNAQNPPNNPFNSTNSFTGSNSLWNMDIDTFDISPYINVGDTSANIVFASGFSRFLQTVVTSIRSELPDATVALTQITGQNTCNNRNLQVNYTVQNTNSNGNLPANIPVSFYANNVLLSTVLTPSPIAIGGVLPLQTTVSIPLSIANTFNLRVVVDNAFSASSTIAESNENNNEASQSVTLIGDTVIPTFSIPTTFCQGANVPVLPLVSTNGISGTWSPSLINNQTSGNYVFTPNAGQPAAAGTCGLPFTLDVTISPLINPTFSIPTTFCQGATVPALPLLSTNNIAGTWLPNMISNQNSGSYVFTPNVGTCGLPFTLNVTISPAVNPTFSIPNTFCQGANVPTLPLLSSNNISGTWLPNVISNQNSGSYIFTPNVGTCGLPFTLNVTISPSITPTFSIPNTFCQGANIPTLPLISANNIAGTWSPNVISNQNSGSYIFTPNPDQCGLPFTLNVVISPLVIPTFSIPTTFCQGVNVPTLPLISSNNISGTWLPNIISNQNSGSYVFTPNPDQCGLPFTLNMTISPLVIPTFSIPTTFCQGANVPTLPLISSNNISGTWSPNVISNQNSGSYIFTPNSGSCGLPFTLNVTISPAVNPTFSIPTTFCQGATVTALPLISSNNISGTWSPNVISNQNSGNYVFLPAAAGTPNSGSCGLPFTLNVTISPSITPTFSIPTTFCQGANVPTLPLISSNNISGTWSPNVISNQNSGSYVFLPNAGQCGLPFTLNVTISPSVNPTFSIPTTFCQGETVPALPLISSNNISGTWLPNVISNQNSGSYVFTPNAGQCSLPFTLNASVQTLEVIQEDVFICLNEDGNAIFPVTLSTGLGGGNYTFSWTENGVPIANTQSLLLVFSAGNYNVIATPINVGCNILFEFEVFPLQPMLVNITLPTADFVSNPTIVVNASGGSGQYQYSFNNLPFQNNSVFNVLEGGSIPIVVKDANGCYTFSETVEVWDYPRFFTPNNDGYNDTWGIANQKPISIEIFNRYGALLKKLSNNERWDGMVNNQILPSTDYWFVIYYKDNKMFKSHFSLKR